MTNNFFISCLLMCFMIAATNVIKSDAQTLYDFNVTTIDGKLESLAKYKGNVVLVVNVASSCGLAPVNYKQLNDLYASYSSKGLKIAAFPSNSFEQEQGSNSDIKAFCDKSNVKFDVYSKIDVNGDSADPLYKWLTKQLGSTLTDDIKWNYTKFLVDKTGKPIKRYESTVEPKDIENDIKAQL